MDLPSISPSSSESNRNLSPRPLSSNSTPSALPKRIQEILAAEQRENVQRNEIIQRRKTSPPRPNTSPPIGTRSLSSNIIAPSLQTSHTDNSPLLALRRVQISNQTAQANQELIETELNEESESESDESVTVAIFASSPEMTRRKIDQVAEKTLDSN